jgi:hypothetical protein
MSDLFFDIETIPTADEGAKLEIAASIKPPGNMSKPETIAKWEAEEKPKLIEEAVAKTSLDGTYGRICCISYAFGDGTIEGIIDRDEKNILKLFFEACMENAKDKKTNAIARHTAIGHAVSSFDLRFTWQRAIINKVQPAICLPWESKPWGEYIRDTMLMWNPAQDKRISLHRLCCALGIESPKDKNDMTGADVARLWAQRRYADILAYAKDDVEATRDCYRRMTL